MSCICSGRVVCTCNGARTSLIHDINAEAPERNPISVEESMALFEEAMSQYLKRDQEAYSKVLKTAKWHTYVENLRIYEPYPTKVGTVILCSFTLGGENQTLRVLVDLRNIKNSDIVGYHITKICETLKRVACAHEGRA